jgi:uncharacterized membrane protein
MINLNNSTMIYKPINQVFDFVSTSENDFEWQYGTLETAKLPESDGGIGSFFRSIGHLMGRRILSTFEVTEYERNKKYGFKSLSGPLDSQTSYTFEMAAGSTRVNISTQVSAGKLFEVDERVLEKRMKKQVKDNLTLLKGILEDKHV